MTLLDVLLQHWRCRKARKEIPAGGRLLDIGTYDGALFRLADARGLGLDPVLPSEAKAREGVTLVRGVFPDDVSNEAAGSFDAATALAVIEHVPEADLDKWAASLARLIRSGGVVVITVPSPAVDHILHVLMRLRLVAGMQAHQHHGFEPDDVLRILTPPQWRLVKHKRFQLRLNNLFVFRRVR